MNSNTFNIKAFVQQRGRLLGQIIAATLVLISLFIIAKLVWMWIEHFQPATSLNLQTTPAVASQSVKPVNANKLAALHVFGEANVSAVQTVQAEETRLNLKLMGVYVASEEALSSAIIQSGSKQKTYLVNDQIEGGRQVTLQQVHNEHIIIKNNGKLEKLTLIENLNQAILASKQTQASIQTDGKTIDKRRDSRLTSDLLDIKRKLSENPASYADLATFQPALDESGQVIGFKVGPGKDPRLFTRLGLRRNDIIRSVNGQTMDNLSALQELQGADAIELNLERNGQPVTLLLNLGAEQPSRQPTNRPTNRPINRDLREPSQRQPNEPELK